MTLLDRAADLLADAGAPSALGLVRRSVRLVNEAGPFLSAEARRRWRAADHPELPAVHFEGVGSWGGDSGSTGGA